MYRFFFFCYLFYRHRSFFWLYLFRPIFSFVGFIRLINLFFSFFGVAVFIHDRTSGAHEHLQIYSVLERHHARVHDACMLHAIWVRSDRARVNGCLELYTDIDMIDRSLMLNAGQLSSECRCYVY